MDGMDLSSLKRNYVKIWILLKNERIRAGIYVSSWSLILIVCTFLNIVSLG